MDDDRMDDESTLSDDEIETTGGAGAGWDATEGDADADDSDADADDSDADADDA